MNADLIALAERCEAAEGLDAQYPSKLLIEAFDLVWPNFNDGPSAFFSFLNAGAYLDAAMTLVPEGLYFQIITNDGFTVAKVYAEGPNTASKAATPALALCAAALRAHTSGEQP